MDLCTCESFVPKKTHGPVCACESEEREDGVGVCVNVIIMSDVL